MTGNNYRARPASTGTSRTTPRPARRRDEILPRPADRRQRHLRLARCRHQRHHPEHQPGAHGPAAGGVLRNDYDAAGPAQAERPSPSNRRTCPEPDPAGDSCITRWGTRSSMSPRATALLARRVGHASVVHVVQRAPQATISPRHSNPRSIRRRRAEPEATTVPGGRRLDEQRRHHHAVQLLQDRSGSAQLD